MKAVVARLKKPTLLLILGVPVFLYLSGLLIVYLFKPNADGFAVLAIILLLGTLLVALVVDSILVRFMNFILLSFLELLLCCGLGLFVVSRQRAYFITISDIKTPYAIIIDDPKGISLADFQPSGFFDKKINLVGKNLIRMNINSFGNRPWYITGPAWWGENISVVSYPPRYPFKWEFDSPVSKHYTDAQKDSILLLEMPGIKINAP